MQNNFINIIWLLLLLAVAAIDFEYRKVKNSLVLLCVVFLFFSVFLQKNVILYKYIIGAIFFSAYMMVFYHFKLMGAGDVKFSFVLGGWLGLGKGVLFVIVISSFLSAIHALYEIFLKNKKFDLNFKERMVTRQIPCSLNMVFDALQFFL